MLLGIDEASLRGKPGSETLEQASSQMFQPLFSEYALPESLCGDPGANVTRGWSNK